MRIRDLYLAEWLVCLVAPVVPVVLSLLVFSPAPPAVWLMGLVAALVVGVACVFLYTFAADWTYPPVLLLAAPFVVPLLSGFLGGGLGLLLGIVHGTWAIVVALPMAVIGFGGGCGISLAQLIRLRRQPNQPRWSFEFPDGRAQERSDKDRVRRRTPGDAGEEARTAH